jgi:23S rRNA pseudouridine1911/1915/1917 synthase
LDANNNITYLYNDQNLIVIDKPAGISVHPGHNKNEETIVSVTKNMVNDIDKDRPGIVHRLDKNTSGVLIIAKNSMAKDILQKQFKDRTVEKTYLALVEGSVKLTEAIIDQPLGRHPKNPLKRTVRHNGKRAITRYKVLNKFHKYTLVELYPKTGRTHQIRIHLAKLGNPIVGDEYYGHKNPLLNRHFLHATEIRFKNIEGESVVIKSNLPEELKNLLASLS